MAYIWDEHSIFRYWSRLPPEKRDREAIRKLAYQLGLKLKKDCQLYSEGLPK